MPLDAPARVSDGWVLSPWTVLIASHAVGASVALVLGPVQPLWRTRGDRLHRLVGRVWSGMMLYTATGSFFFGGWTKLSDLFLRLLAVITLVGVTLGIILARRGRIRHTALMISGYLGLVGAFIGAWAVPDRRVPSWFAVHPELMSLIAASIVAGSMLFVLGGSLRYRSSVSG